ncbi:MAG: large protein, partial [Cytophagaceae bacterium]|nr:large protein [Cytophagaceae bacterium]
YTPSASDYSAGLATLVLTSTANVNGCLPVSDTMRVIIAPEPTLNLGPNITVCGDAGTVQLNATTTNGAGITWSSANNTFNNPNINNPIYTITAADPVPGIITMNVTLNPSASSGTCNAVNRSVNVTLTAVPTVTVPPSTTVCTTTPTVNLAPGSNITVASGGVWTTTGTGTFSPNNTYASNPSYIPSTADLLLPSVVLTLTTTGNGQCQAYSSPLTVNFDRQPTVTASPDRTVICSGNVVNFISFSTNATGVLWTKNGADGTFDDDTSATPVFTPGPNDIANGGMIFTVTTTGVTTCNQAVRNIAIGIVPSPVASVNAGFDQILCADVDTVQLNGFIAVALGGEWKSSGTGIFLPNINDLSAKYIPSATEKDPATPIVITLESTGNGICAPTSDDMSISFTPIPTVNAGADQIVCADTAYVQLNPTITIATGGSWTTNGTGVFAPGNTNAITRYFLTEDDIARGILGFTVTTTGNGTCKAYDSSMVVTITPKPTLSLGPDRIVCASAATVNFNASTTIATSALWSTSGAGSFSPNPNLATAYTVMPADTAIKNISIFAASANQGNCKAVYDTLQLTFQPRPIVVAGPPISSCANVESVNLLNAAVYNATGGRWSSGGTGNFSSPNNQLNNVYSPSPADVASGTVTLTLSSTGNGQCNLEFNQLTLSITASPVVVANPAILCEPTLGASLSGTVSAPFNGQWSSSLPGGSFAPSPTLISTYFPSPAETAAGKAVLTLTSTNNGTCNPVTATIDIVIEPLPIANAGPDQFICTNGIIDLNAVTIQPSISYTWAVSGGAVFASVPNTQATVPANTGYVLTASDAKGCDVSDTMQAFVFTLPTFTISPSPACFEENMVLQSNPVPMPVVGGTYQWFKDNVLLSGENKIFTNPPLPGTYSIVYTYGSCNTNPASIVVSSPPRLSTEDITACTGDTLTLRVELFSPPTYPTGVSYNWTPNPSNTSTLFLNPVLTDTTLYYVTVTDNTTLCPTQDSIYVLGIPRPIIPLINDTICVGASVRLTARPTNIADLDQYQKTTFNWLQDGNILAVTDSIYFATTTGIYTAGVNIDRCGNTQRDTIFVAPYPVSTLDDNAKFCDETDNFKILDAGVADTYVWQTGNVADTLRTLTVSPANDRYYAVQIGNLFGCTVNDSIFVKNICAPRIYIPNAFTPGLANPDQIFTVFGKHIYNYKMVVFNRWGEAIFETTDKSVGWDGKYLGEDMPTGVYPVIITYEGREEYKGQQKYVGQVTLIR